MFYKIPLQRAELLQGDFHKVVSLLHATQTPQVSGV